MTATKEGTANVIGRVILAILFILSGTLHFISPQPYIKIVPPYLPAHLPIVYISGAAEILGGIGLLIPSTRQPPPGASSLCSSPFSRPTSTWQPRTCPLPASWGHSGPQWLRVPLQLPLIYWAWLYTRTP